MSAEITIRARQRFKRDQKILGMSNNLMAELLCCTTSHIEHMRSGRRAITAATRKLIDVHLKLKKRNVI